MLNRVSQYEKSPSPVEVAATVGAGAASAAAFTPDEVGAVNFVRNFVNDVLKKTIFESTNLLLRQLDWNHSQLAAFWLPFPSSQLPSAAYSPFKISVGLIKY